MPGIILEELLSDAVKPFPELYRRSSVREITSPVCQSGSLQIGNGMEMIDENRVVSVSSCALRGARKPEQ